MQRRISIGKLIYIGFIFEFFILIYRPMSMIKKIPSEINLAQSSLEINLY